MPTSGSESLSILTSEDKPLDAEIYYIDFLSRTPFNIDIRIQIQFNTDIWIRIPFSLSLSPSRSVSLCLSFSLSPELNVVHKKTSSKRCACVPNAVLPLSALNINILNSLDQATYIRWSLRNWCPGVELIL